MILSDGHGYVEIEIDEELVNNIAQSGDNKPAVLLALQNENVFKQFAYISTDILIKSYKTMFFDNDKEPEKMSRKDLQMWILWDMAWQSVDN